MYDGGVEGCTVMMRCADDVHVGDAVVVSVLHGNLTSVWGKVVEVEVAPNHVPVAGWYAPLTQSGLIVVDDVLCSSYAIVDGHLESWAHYAMWPLRSGWWSYMFGGSNAEKHDVSRNDIGSSSLCSHTHKYALCSHTHKYAEILIWIGSGLGLVHRQPASDSTHA